MRRIGAALSALLVLASVVPVMADTNGEPMIVGFNCDMAFQYRQIGIGWEVEGEAIDLMRFMSLNGSSGVRVGVGTNATGSLSIDLAIKAIRWARESALMVDVFFYLSSIGADIGKQPAPIGWEDKSLTERAYLAGEHLKSCAATLVRENCTDHLYEVGNEIDYGLCGSFVSDPTRWPETEGNIAFLKSTVWQEEAIILKEAIAGLYDGDPDAKVVLHLAHWWNLTFCMEFFGFMESQGVPFDYVGLSYYPSSGIYDLGEFMMRGEADANRSAIEFQKTVMGLIEMRYEVVISEFAYPCTSDIPGMFSSFDKQLSNYPLDASGQAEFIEDTLLWLHDQRKVVAAFYFAPHFYETFLTDVWGAFALFDENGESRPGLFSIGKIARLQPELAAQLESRELIVQAWDAIESSESDGRTEGLLEARLDADEAWLAYSSGEFGNATRLAGDAIERARDSYDPALRRALQVIILLIVGGSVAASLVVLRRRIKRLVEAYLESIKAICHR